MSALVPRACRFEPGLRNRTGGDRPAPATRYNGAFATQRPETEPGPRPQAAARWPRTHSICLALIPP